MTLPSKYVLTPGQEGRARQYKRAAATRPEAAVRRVQVTLWGMLTLGLILVVGVLTVAFSRAGSTPSAAAAEIPAASVPVEAPPVASTPPPAPVVAAPTASPTSEPTATASTTGAPAVSPLPWNPAAGATADPQPTCYYPDGRPIPAAEIPDHLTQEMGFPTMYSGCAIDRVTGGYWTAPGTTPTTTPGPIASGLNRIAAAVGTR